MKKTQIIIIDASVNNMLPINIQIIFVKLAVIFARM